MAKPILFEYFVPVTYIRENIHGKERFTIRGIAINETVTRNNVKYIAEELRIAAPTLKGRPLLKDHKNEVDAIVGRVRNSGFDEMNHNITFEAEVMDLKMREMIADGRISNVSIGAKVDSLEESKSESESYVTARGMEILELSLVPVPGDAGATIDQSYALAESFNHFKVALAESVSDSTNQKLKEENMAEKKIEEAAPTPQPATQAVDVGAVLKEQLAAFEKLLSEKFDLKIAELKEQTKIAESKEEKVQTKGRVMNEADTMDWHGYITERGENGKRLLWKMPKYNTSTPKGVSVNGG